MITAPLQNQAGFIEKVRFFMERAFIAKTPIQRRSISLPSSNSSLPIIKILSCDSEDEVSITIN